MLEPLGVAHNAVERLEVAGEDLLVIGCGPVGLLVLMVAKALGAKRCVIKVYGTYIHRDNTWQNLYPSPNNQPFGLWPSG